VLSWRDTRDDLADEYFLFHVARWQESWKKEVG